jgi:hypothetical protein
MGYSMWRNASPRNKRILSIVLVFITAVIIFTIASLIPVNAQDANQISNNLNQTVTAMKQNDTLLPYIFGNNFMICLLMFIPIIGPIAGFIILYDTGNAIGAISTVQGFPPVLGVALTLIPIGIIEFIAYSTAMTESIWLFRRALQGRGLRELRNAALFVSICAIVLFLGAALETALVSIGY